MTETKVHRIRGVAGAGKSTRMLGDPEKGIDGMVRDIVEDGGYDVTEFRWVSFSSSHESELTENVRRSVQPLLDGMDDDVVEEWSSIAHVSTLHSLCLELNPFVDAEDIICPSYDSSHEIYETFWEPRGISFSPSSQNPLRIVYHDEDTDMSRAEKLVTIDQLLTLLGDRYSCGGITISVGSIQELPVEIPDLHPERVVDLIEEWRLWKDKYGYYEHHDYILEMANSSRTPDCKVMMVDEMQDYAPLEYAVIRDWIESGELDHVVLAGDEFQSIYGFKMASPHHFIRRDVDDERVLNQSYRCPRDICDLAREILPESNISSATNRAGQVYDASVPTSSDLADIVRETRREYGEVFILTRTNRQTGYVSRALQREGVTFCTMENKDIDEDEERDTWRDDLIQIVAALRRAKHQTGRVPLSAANTVISHTVNPKVRQRKVDTPFDELDMQSSEGGVVDLWSAFPDCSNVTDILRLLSLSEIEQDMVKSAVEVDEILEPDRVAIGTIHSSKGRQSPATLILDAYPEKLAEKYRTDSEFRAEEDRLGYVAVTRASESVVILRDFTDSASFPPIASENIGTYSREGVMSYA